MRVSTKYKLVDIAILVAFTCVTCSYIQLGYFGDEEEKITTALFTTLGMMPYRDVLVNHGPLMYLVAIAGYATGDVGTSFLALRIIPIALSLMIISSAQRITSRKRINSISGLLTAAFLTTIWTEGTIRMGIYHGVGGLIATLIVLESTLPCSLGRKAWKEEIIPTICLCSLLLTTSITYAPFIILSLTVLGLTALKKNIKYKTNRNEETKKRDMNRSHWNIAKIIANVSALSPLISICVLIISGTISLEGLYRSHIYFNLEILGALKGKIEIASIPKSLDQAIATLLSMGIIIMPIWAYKNRRKLSFLGLATVICLSGSVLSLGYRNGLTNLNDFHSLAYIVTACTLCITTSLILINRETEEKKRMTISTKLKISTLSAIAIMPLIIVNKTRNEGKIAISIGSKKHLSQIQKKDREESKETMLVDKIVTRIENRGKKATIFVWPFRPNQYTWYERVSKYPVTGYVWYHETVETDKNMKPYHICNNRELEKPDIILYQRWIVADYDSDRYGKCLLELQERNYIEQLPGVYINKKHQKYLNK